MTKCIEMRKITSHWLVTESTTQSHMLGFSSAYTHRTVCFIKESFCLKQVALWGI